MAGHAVTAISSGLTNPTKIASRNAMVNYQTVNNHLVRYYVLNITNRQANKIFVTLNKSCKPGTYSHELCIAGACKVKG